MVSYRREQASKLRCAHFTATRDSTLSTTMGSQNSGDDCPSGGPQERQDTLLKSKEHGLWDAGREHPALGLFLGYKPQDAR